MPEAITSSEAAAAAASCPLLLKQTHALLLRLPNRPRFNLAIRALSKSPPLRRHSLLLYARMIRLALTPDNFTYPFLLSSAAALSSSRLPRELHSRALRSGNLAFLHVSNALVHVYGKLGDLASARRVFDEMPMHDLVTRNSLLAAHARSGMEMGVAREVFDGMPERNLISWNALVIGYVSSGEMKLARDVFDEMPVRSIVSWNAVIIGHVKAGDVDSARALFDRMPERNLVSWASLISGYARAGRPREALELFGDMDRIGLSPDAATMIGVISSSAQLGDAHFANWIESYVGRNGIERNERILTALVDMHAKCGNAAEACRVFEEIPRKDAFAYTALIGGLASHGYGSQALEFFDRMQKEGVKPDGVTYIGVLSACSQAGLVDEGVKFWDEMVKTRKIDPCSDHYSCMVDMLSRVGKLEQARKLVGSMPDGPCAGALGALLSACRSYGEVGIAEAVANQLFELEPENTGNYMLLWGVYAARGQWDEALRVRERMEEKGIKKLPGSSWR